jgi:uncharacterized membrane protein (DUF485 family)
VSSADGRETTSGADLPARLDGVSHRDAAEILASPELARLVRRRWLVSLVLTLCLFAGYYGYVVAIALRPDLLARRLGEHPATLGIPVGAGVIVLSWALTGVYVLWANGWHDRTVRELRARLGR